MMRQPGAQFVSLSITELGRRGIVQDAAMRQKLFEMGWKAVGSLPDALGSRMAQDAALYGAIIRLLGIAEK